MSLIKVLVHDLGASSGRVMQAVLRWSLPPVIRGSSVQK